MKPLRPLILLAVVAFALTLATTGLRAEPAPQFNLQDTSGKPVKLSDYKGKVVILDFWATWCPPCRAEIPNFVDLQKQYGKQGLAVIGVSLDQGDVADVVGFAKAQGINYPILMGNQDVAAAYGGIEAIPATFVIDQSGNVVGRHVGFTDKSEFEAEVKKLLPAAPAA
jgi:cytochrome c biogenesis protein CcmG/thiol:disulfide interchange protein DsbE